MTEQNTVPYGEVFPLDEPILRRLLAQAWGVRNTLSFMRDQTHAGLLACIVLPEDRELMIPLQFRFRAQNDFGIGIMFCGPGEDQLFLYCLDDCGVVMQYKRPSAALRKALARIFLEPEND